MASFKNLGLTTAGEDYLQGIIMGEIKETLVFTGIAIGDGKLASGEAPASRATLVHEVHRLPIEHFDKSARGKVVMTARLATDILAADLLHREIGLYAADEQGREILMTYGNAGDEYDYIPAAGDKAAIYKTISVTLTTGGAEVTFADLPSDDLVSVTAMNARIAEVLPQLAYEAALEVCNGVLADAKNSAIAEINGVAGSVLESAEAAKTSETNAAASAMTASGNATASANSAVAASTSATEAATSKTACEGMVEQMQGLVNDVVTKDENGIITVNGVNFAGQYGAYVSDVGNLVFAPAGKLDSMLIDPDGRMYMSGSGHGVIISSYATFYENVSFSKMIINNSGVYYTPSGTSVQIGAVTAAADGAMHTWLKFDNAKSVNGAVFSSININATGPSYNGHLYLGSSGGDVVITGNQLNMGGSRKIVNLPNGTNPQDGVNKSQLSGGSSGVLSLNGMTGHVQMGLGMMNHPEDSSIMALYVYAREQGDSVEAVADHSYMMGLKGFTAGPYTQCMELESSGGGGDSFKNYTGEVHIKALNGQEVFGIDSSGNITLGHQDGNISMKGTNIVAEVSRWRVDADSMVSLELNADGNVETRANVIRNMSWYSWSAQADSIYSMEIDMRGDINFAGKNFGFNAERVVTSGSVRTMEL